jgi:FkbM family methyltransferase
VSLVSVPDRARRRVERLARRTYDGLRALNYRHGFATPKRTVAGTHWSYELLDTHTRDTGLAVLARLPPGAVVVDVGAHVGEYAVPLSLRGQTVHAVEPNPVAVARLERNRRRNDADLDVHPVGLGATPGERAFYRSSSPKLSSFDRAAATRWDARVTGVERVPVRTLDGLRDTDPTLPPPDALKVDTEGAELAVLRGGRATVERHHPTIVLEHHADAGGTPDALRSWLRDRAYRIADHGETWVCWHADSPLRPPA